MRPTSSATTRMPRLTLLVSSNYPGAQVDLWQYFGASVDHLVFALCFAAFVLGDPDQALSVSAYLRRPRP
jgi:hypothetical protein